MATSGGCQGVGPGPAAPRKGDTRGFHIDTVITTTDDVQTLRVKLPGLREVGEGTQSGAVNGQQLYRAGLSRASVPSCHHHN